MVDCVENIRKRPRNCQNISHWTVLHVNGRVEVNLNIWSSIYIPLMVAAIMWFSYKCLLQKFISIQDLNKHSYYQINAALAKNVLNDRKHKKELNNGLLKQNFNTVEPPGSHKVKVILIYIHFCDTKETCSSYFFFL